MGRKPIASFCEAVRRARSELLNLIELGLNRPFASYATTLEREKIQRGIIIMTTHVFVTLGFYFL